MSNSIDFNTPARIIRSAMRDAGLLEKGDDPDGEDFADCMNRLNDIINLEQTQGIKLWLNNLVVITLTAGVASYTLGPGGTGTRAMRAMEAYYQRLDGSTYPLTMLSWERYNTLSSRLQMGMPNSFFPNKQQTSTIVTLWPIPDANAAVGALQVLQQIQVANMVKLDDTMSFPQEWFMFLRWALADDISTGQSAEIMARCSSKANAFRQALQDWDVEDAGVSFAPSPQSGFGRR